MNINDNKQIKNTYNSLLHTIKLQSKMLTVILINRLHRIYYAFADYVQHGNIPILKGLEKNDIITYDKI